MKVTQLIAVAMLLIPSGALGQVTLDSLWPNDDGATWTYDFNARSHSGLDFTTDARMWFDGTTITAGGEAQVLNFYHDPVPDPAGPSLSPLLRSIWLARPDLRDALEAHHKRSVEVCDGGNSWPLLLHCGYFMESSESIQMWQPDWNHPTWTYLESDLSLGATFTHQLVPELADNIFLHGTVAALDASIFTPAGSFDNALKMDYLIDYGVSTGTDENGDDWGTYHGETQGHVYFVPAIGPVDMLEEFIPFVWVDCIDECPPDTEELVGVAVQTLTLALKNGPVPVESSSWGAVKALF